MLRQMVDTVGQPGKAGAHIQKVISVGMLSEGWDAKTVTHIMGLRAFSSQLLCEQVVGRGLRRTSYDGNPYRFAKPPRGHIIHHSRRTGDLTVCRLVAGVASAGGKWLRTPVAKPHVEPGERCEYDDHRRSIRTSGNELDALPCEVALLFQLGVKAVPSEPLDVEGSLQAIQQVEGRVVQSLEALRIREA